MEFGSLSLILTEDCNFDCSYCLQKKEPRYMNSTTIEKSIDFFYSYLKDPGYIIFYGGEPLLAFDQIKYTVSLVESKQKAFPKTVNYSTSTNGSLLTDEMLEFFNRHGFTLLLSFDGLTQDINRKSGSNRTVMHWFKELQKERYRNIDFITNSVFDPGSVDYLARSMQYLIGQGGPKLMFSLTEDHQWSTAALDQLENQLDMLVAFLVDYYKETGLLPVRNFSDEDSTGTQGGKSRFVCEGGVNRIAVSPDAELYGCVLYHDYLKRRKESREYQTYCFGGLETFILQHPDIYPSIVANYAFLRQSCFYTQERHCFECPNLDHCSVCPAMAAQTTGTIGKIPLWMCRLKEIVAARKEKFQRIIETSS